jgi:hypothetical protein
MTMKAGSKEWHDLRAQFERGIKAMPVFIGPVAWEGNSYTDKAVNDLWIGYMHG